MVFLQKIMMMTEHTTPTTLNVKAVWDQACAQLQLELSPGAFSTWILMNPLAELYEIDEQTVVGVISSPTAFHSTNVKKNFESTLITTLEKVLQKKMHLEFRVGAPISLKNDSSSTTQATDPTSNQNSPNDLGGRTPVPFSFSQQNSSQSQPKNNPNRPQSPRVEDLFSANSMSANSVNQAAYLARQAGLRPDFTFETFAVSSSNEMAHAAATAVSQQPGQAYNPLFLYGDVGVGKTHLMHAIGNNIIKNDPNAKVLYVTGEEFTNQIVNAIQTKKALRFKEKYRSATVFLIDDIQFIAGKNTVQEEFFHTFNALIKQQGQIILTSDRPPHEIQLLEDRLRSRFEAGLMIDIQQPSFELRTAILLIKAQARNLSIPMDIAQLIASQVESARKIEGILTKILSHVELQKKELTIEAVTAMIEGDKKTMHELRLKVKPAEVIKTVADHYHIKQAVIRGLKRTKEVVLARHVAMYLLYKDLGIAYAETGRWFSNRDHTSAMHACKKIESLVMTNPTVKQDVSAIRTSLTVISR